MPFAYVDYLLAACAASSTQHNVASQLILAHRDSNSANKTAAV